MSTAATSGSADTRKPVKTLTMNFAAGYLLLVAIFTVVIWHGLSRLGFLQESSDANRTAMEKIRREVDETEQEQDEAITGMTKSMTDFSDRLRSFESELADARGQFDLLDQLATERLAESALSRARIVEVRGLADQVSSALDGLQQHHREWYGRVKSLMTDDSGQRLATSPELVALADELLSHDHMTERRISDLRQQLQELRVPVDAAAGRQDAIIRIPESSVTALENLLATANEARQALSDDSGRLDSLLRQAAEATAETPTLDAALAGHREQRFDALNNEVQKRIETVRDEAAEAIATAAEEAERAKAAAEVARIRLVATAQTEADAIRGRIAAQRIRDAAADDQRAEQERQRAAQTLAEKRKRMREYQAALPGMKRVLVPFFSSGQRQLNGTRWRFIDTPAPLSLAGIQATGALQNSESGYEAFLWLAGGSDNDRPNGPFPNYIGGNIEMNYPALVAPIRRAQVLIEQYGDLLVADGLLSP